METIMIQRANVILEVPEERKAEFMQKGYSVIDKNGKVLEAAIPTDTNELKKAVKELTEKLAKSEENVDKLKKACTKLKEQLKNEVAATEE